MERDYFQTDIPVLTHLKLDRTAVTDQQKAELVVDHLTDISNYNTRDFTKYDENVHNTTLNYLKTNEREIYGPTLPFSAGLH